MLFRSTSRDGQSGPVRRSVACTASTEAIRDAICVVCAREMRIRDQERANWGARTIADLQRLIHQVDRLLHLSQPLLRSRARLPAYLHHRACADTMRESSVEGKRSTNLEGSVIDGMTRSWRPRWNMSNEDDIRKSGALHPLLEPGAMGDRSSRGETKETAGAQDYLTVAVQVGRCTARTGLQRLHLEPQD